MPSLTQVQSPARTARIAVSALFFSAGFCFSSWASRIPAIQQKLQLSEAGLGMVLLSLPVGLMLSLPVSGFLVARYGSRRTVVIAGVVYAFLLPFLGVVSFVWQLAMVLFLFGFAGNLLNISMNTQAVNVEDAYGRSIMASFHGVWSVAGFSGAAIGMLMLAFSASPFLHFCIITVLVWSIVFVVYKYLPVKDVHSGSNVPVFAKPDGTLLKLGLIAFCCMVCEGTMFDWSGIYFAKEVQAPKSLTTLGYVAFMTTMAGGRFAGDWLSVRLGRKNMIRISGLLIASGLMLAVALPYIIPATIGFLITGMGVSSVVPLVYSAAGRSGKIASGVALAAVSTIGYLGFLFGPPAIGLIAQAFSLRWSFTLIAFLGLGTTLLAGFSKIEK
ncbi:MFS transporter [Agriterribacter sp.]|uniref:MFS transporter n=1 Tax=Agriterribacter sp. TaxID=2821509 RepID=UPI002BEB5EA8|nr:MFS transporter [Agriterribacter sp.]HRO45044.1 MFS transporter [Agriterribacter sp.]HRQ15515.1 MFS transporter [Agriterribacter sp.]